ncbi:MAG: PD40 domain-containing protein [Saprospirales bacterium]|nr:PD40 domain-containing protein [Saprospirales bacterium]
MSTLFRSILLSLLLLPGFSGLNAQSTLSKANKQYELHAYNLAAKSYLDIVEKQPNNTEALSKLADCYWHLNKMDDAKAYYQRAIDTEKADPRTYLMYGQTLKSIAQYELAKKQFQEYAKTYQLEGSHFIESCDFALGNQQVLADFEVTSELINTTSTDFGPTFFLNDVVFSSSRIDMKRANGSQQSDWTGSANNQLFISSRDQNSVLTQPSFLRSELRNIYNEGPVSYSPDGRWVVITKNNFVDGTRQIPSSGLELSLYIAEVTDKGDWTNPLPFPHNGSGYSNGFGSFSPDGSALYYASNRPDGFGGYDIFVSNRVGNSWSTPENLGPAVNSVGDEITPYFNGTYLYFASNWHTGFGGFDIFKAQRSYNTWGSVENLGTGINSPRDDYGFIFDEANNIGYLTSNRVGGKGLEDIYRVQKSLDNIVFYVMNASNRTPVPNALVDLTSCGQGRFMTDNNGMFTFRTTSGLNCNVEIAKEGYANNTLSVTTLGGHQGRNFEVFLKKIGEDYFGGIINVQTGQPIAQALVRAISQTDGSSLEAFSDDRGGYALGLSPNTSYIIRYSKGGFVDVNRTLRTGDGKDKNILGTISISPNTAISNVPDQYNIPGSVPSDYNVKSPLVTEGYAVQVAAIALGKTVDLVGYRNKLADFGTVYVQEEGDHQKVRLGPFATEDEAKSALKQVKTKGYKTAFMVRQANTSGNDLAPKGGVPAAYSGGEAQSQIMVQLAAYKDARNFEDASVQDIGVVEKRIKGDFTIVLLSGYNTKAEAQNAMVAAKKRGFPGAYLVAETIPGEFVRVD